MRARRIPAGLAAAVVAMLLAAATAVPARAGVLTPICKALQPVPLAPGCTEAKHGLTAGRQLLGADPGGVVGGLVGGDPGGVVGGLVGGVAGDVASVGLGAIASWAALGAKFALHETATMIDNTSSPHLEAPWFQRVYWRLAGISVLLTLPCLFAAAVQALLRSDLALLARAAFGYLPAAMLGVGICAQITSLLLAAVDELSSLVSSAAGQAGSSFLNRAGDALVALSAASRSPFLALMIAGFTVAGAVVLWLELMMRAAAVYVVVAMLPLAFAALVWPARRVWAMRALELLAALILAKLAMVTVLTLGGAALQSAPNAAGYLSGLVLLVLGAFSPWAMLRLVPLAELASGAAGRLRVEAGLPGPELLSAAGAGAAQRLGGAAAAHILGGAGSARAAAESVIARLHSDRGPDDPGPADPEPVDPGPADPEPVDPGPADPEPIDPGPAQPGPTDPVPADPGSAGPGSADRPVTDPAPAETGPPEPAPSAPETPESEPASSTHVIPHLLEPDALEDDDVLAALHAAPTAREADPGSSITVPDFEMPEIELSGEARWREGPLRSDHEPQPAVQPDGSE